MDFTIACFSIFEVGITHLNGIDRFPQFCNHKINFLHLFIIEYLFVSAPQF